MLALLAWVCLPGLAQASSAGYEYQDAPESATGSGRPPSEPNHQDGSNSTAGVGGSAHKSNTPGGGSDAGGGAAQKQGGSGGEAKSGGHQDGKGSSVGKEKTPGAGHQPASSVEPGSDSGDSSPLGPILVGIAILAGGSIAYLMYRRRRAAEGDSADSSPSPEAS